MMAKNEQNEQHPFFDGDKIGVYHHGCKASTPKKLQKVAIFFTWDETP